jgi:type VI protein secretion system component VasF
LLALLTAVGAPLVWLLLGYLESSQRREVLKQSTIAKVMLLLFVLLTLANYFLNQYQSQQEAQQLLTRLRQSGIDVAPPR